MIDIAISFTPSDPDDSKIFPGVLRQFDLNFELTNLNEPDMNFDIAEVEVPQQGANFEFTARVVDVDLTLTGDVMQDIATFGHVITDGNVSALLNTSGIIFFTMSFYVRILFKTNTSLYEHVGVFVYVYDKHTHFSHISMLCFR